MSEQEQVQAFADDLDKLVARYAAEYDLTHASAVGVLQMKIWLLCQHAQEDGNEPEPTS